MTTPVPDVRAVLCDPRFIVPPAPADGAAPLGTMRWLRRTVPRFSNGAVHLRRRALAEGELRLLDPARLRAEGRSLTRQVTRDAAPYVPVAVLGAALGARGGSDKVAAFAEVVAATRVVAAAYRPGAAPEAMARADEGVQTLVGLLPDGEPEALANRIGLLVQTCDATAALITNALAARSSQSGQSADELVAEILRLDPPVRGTQRVAAAGATLHGRPVAEGTEVPLGLAAADAPFGHGIRPCPGSLHAVALACGVLDVLLEETPS
ncbi:hypothetical protein J7I98_20525 [Streptomyces sp. ISL-98]|uniref:hypothetical protein n=1 Tax=Streptomyces sp. ISL-98 TaxID=2819192 RepID=UPI001BE66A7B|nr:hypothetical protein [Streptomyces sp. ISL-98]MBT2508229.1 hypothetical protein [Streptomyces sp. ISL-98]